MYAAVWTTAIAKIENPSKDFLEFNKIYKFLFDENASSGSNKNRIALHFLIGVLRVYGGCLGSVWR